MRVMRPIAWLMLPFLTLWLGTSCGQIGEEPGDETAAPPEDCENEVDDNDDGLIDCDDPDCDGAPSCL